MRPKAIKTVPEGDYIPAGNWFYYKNDYYEVYKKFFHKDTPAVPETYLIEGLESPITPVELQVGHFYTIQNGNDEFFAEVISFHGHAAKYLNVELPDGRRFDLAMSEIEVLKEWKTVEHD